MKSLINIQQVQEAGDRIRTIDVERNYRIFSELAEQHHEIGAEIDALVKGGEDKVLLVKYLVDHGAAKETTLYVSHQFYTRWPVLEDMYDELKIEKALSWNYVRSQLQAPKEEKQQEKGLCTHQCEYHQKLDLPRKSLGGGRI